jgi:hypothetical protein
LTRDEAPQTIGSGGRARALLLVAVVEADADWKRKTAGLQPLPAFFFSVFLSMPLQFSNF